MVYVPAPAIDGSNVFPVTPVPVKFPPVGVPLKLIAASLTHTNVFVKANETVGNVFTVTSAV